MDGKPRMALVWTFRVERYDSAGNRLPPTPVLMRGFSFNGALHDGDLVQVDAGGRPGETLEVDEVRNLTTNVVVRARKAPMWVWLLRAVAVAAFLIFVAVFLWAFFSTPFGP
ncbi:hypothetical protein ACI78V_05120 [Geodermatophilus sp. SYSU D00742]